jgi:guanylate kinase
MNKPSIFNISGPYGVGKDTMINSILDAHGSRLHRVNTVTTRSANASADPSYRSVTNEEFAQITKQGLWITNEQLGGRFAYATSIDEIEQQITNGKICIHSIFPGENGAAKLRQYFGSRLVSVALLPVEGEEEEQIGELRRRMEIRGREPTERIEEKLSAQCEQIYFILKNVEVQTSQGVLPVFDKTIVNDQLAKGLKEVMQYFNEQFPQLNYE